ncbi:MAG TPA: hypothetical protein VKU88_06805 [Acidimicrobiales bacterium]|nr:hypothetical protein [Acidimicrobiales bacterium]
MAVVVCMLAGILVLPVLYSDHLSGTASTVGPFAPVDALSGYTFLRLDPSGTPVRWNPCSTLYYETNLAGAPPYVAVDLQLAVEKVSQATGLLFADEGSTTASPPAYGTLGAVPDVRVGASGASTAGTGASPSGASSVGTGASSPGASSVGTGASPPGVGDGPVLVDWDPARPPASPSTTGAYAKTVPVAAVDRITGEAVYVTGSVVIGSAAARLAPGFGPHSLGVLLLHELGRLVGLGPVAAGGEIMNPHVLSSQTDSFGAGDLAGLKRLGVSAGCLTVPAGAMLDPTS